MLRLILTAQVLLLLSVGCGVKKKTVAEQPIGVSEQQLKEMLSSDDNIYWIKMDNNIGQPLRPEIKLPKKYVAYMIDQERLQDYFYKLKERKTNNINIPLLGEMKQYALSEANTMSPELAAKYPEIQSLKGHNIENRSEQIFVDIDGRLLRVKIQAMDAAYIVEPYETDRGLFYLVYNLLDTGYPKERFELPQR